MIMTRGGNRHFGEMFRASVYHLCLHAVTTDFAIYKSLSDSTRSMNNLMFAISQAEDYAIKGHMSASGEDFCSTLLMRTILVHDDFVTCPTKVIVLLE